MDGVYYKIFVADEGLRPVCLQESDEKDYSQWKFFSQFKFKTEEEAQQIINDTYSFIGRYVVVT